MGQSRQGCLTMGRYSETSTVCRFRCPIWRPDFAFYRDALGHQLIWQTETAAGLRLADSATELVVQTERPELEPNLSVASADAAARQFVAAGGTLLVAPFEIERLLR